MYRDEVLPTYYTPQDATERPTMGGKTIQSICSVQKRMSSHELKLLSRRIDPHAPLGPHASPKKPPLPKALSKRGKYSCGPCQKVYKTRAGFQYHQEKCKYQKRSRKKQMKIQCICDLPTYVENTMIECIHCHSWLHVACVSIMKEEDYCCPRCQLNETEKIIQYLEQGMMLPSIEPIEKAKTPPITSFMDYDDFWNSNQEFSTYFNSNDWCPDELPSLLFSEDSITHDISSSPQQPDWFQFANLEQDFNFLN